MDADRTPVIIGVGQINDRPSPGEAGLDSVGLMEAALRNAERDAGFPCLADLDSLAVVDQISFPGLGDVSQDLAGRLGATPRFCSQTEYPYGDSPTRLLNEAANRIGTGEVRIAAVTGGEALRTAAQRARSGHPPDRVAPSAARAAAERRASPYRQRYGLTAAVEVYPLYENAIRAAYGQTLAEGQAESAEIWSRFSQVARDNSSAWLREALPPEQIIKVTADNRQIAFPYTKLMVANSSVNQGAAFIVASLAEARAQGVPETRLVYVGLGAAASESDDPLQRDRYDQSASLGTSIRKALELNRISAADLNHVELYSCFPCIPKMARRELGWPAARPLSVFGGLTFGGGPIANYMSHAVAAMVDRLRAAPGNGLLFGNGGTATRNHAILLSSAYSGAKFPQDFNVQPDADSERGAVPPLIEQWSGPATIETYTALYERDGSVRHGIVVARTAVGGRTVAIVPASDERGIALLTGGTVEPVGRPGEIVQAEDGLQQWRFADDYDSRGAHV